MIQHNFVSSRMVRERMVEEQIMARGVCDERVLSAMRQVPREVFVPAQWRSEAYGDGAMPIGYRQTISQPYMVAVMAELLQLRGHETVLEIGTGSGYSAAILSLLAQKVVTMERIPELLVEANNCWQTLGLTNIEAILGDGTLGCRAQAPYEAIVVTAAAPRVPQHLFLQLAHHGRMVVPVGGARVQDLCVVQQDELGHPVVTTQFACAFVPLIGQDGWPE